MKVLQLQYELEWYWLYGQVVCIGILLQFELEVCVLLCWYLVEVVWVGDLVDYYVVVLFFDVIVCKQIEVELVESEVCFSVLVDGLLMLVWVLDECGYVCFVNSVFIEFFGGDEQCVFEDVWCGLVYFDDVFVFEYELQEVFKVQWLMYVLVCGWCVDGQWCWLEMNVCLCFLCMGCFIGLVGSSLDVIEWCEIEMVCEELLQFECVVCSVVENMVWVKDEFLVMLLYELCILLIIILGWSELLFQCIDEISLMYKGLGVIVNSVMVQKCLILDMLDLSSMLLGKVQLEVEVLDLCVQLIEVMCVQELVVEGKVLNISLVLFDDLCLVLGDVMCLQQILWNLFFNVIKFIFVEGIVVVILVVDVGYWLIIVIDFGDGIVFEFLCYLFGCFCQVDGIIICWYGGLGLGLVIVQQLVELYGGVVVVSSDG